MSCLTEKQLTNSEPPPLVQGHPSRRQSQEDPILPEAYAGMVGQETLLTPVRDQRLRACRTASR